MKVRIEKNIILNICEYMTILFVILECRSVYAQSITKDYHLGTLVIASLLILNFAYILHGVNRRQMIRSFTFIGCWTLYILIFSIFSGGAGLYRRFLVGYILFFLMWVQAIYNGRYKEVMLKYVKIICLLSVISIILWILGSLLQLIAPNCNMYINWGTQHTVYGYYGIQFETQKTSLFEVVFRRNTALFSEAPMYSLHLVVAFLLATVVMKKRKKIVLLILGVTILTTVSFTGIIAIILIVLMPKIVGFLKDLLIKKRIKYKNLILPILVIFGGIVAIYLLNAKLNTTSGSTRLDDYIAAFQVWKQQILFGVGYGDSSENISNYISSFRAGNTGFSNSIMIILVEGGIWFLMAFIIPSIVTLIKALRSKNMNVLVSLVVWLYLMITTLFPHNYLMIGFIAFWGACAISGTTNIAE